MVARASEGSGNGGFGSTRCETMLISRGASSMFITTRSSMAMWFVPVSGLIRATDGSKPIGSRPRFVGRVERSDTRQRRSAWNRWVSRCSTHPTPCAVSVWNRWVSRCSTHPTQCPISVWNRWVSRCSTHPTGARFGFVGRVERSDTRHRHRLRHLRAPPTPPPLPRALPSAYKA